MKENIFVLRVTLHKIKGKFVRNEETGERDYVRKYPEYVTEIDFQNQDIIAFVIDDYIETRSAFTVVFQGTAYRLQKAHKKDRWEKEDGLYTFLLCSTPQDTWRALRGFIYELLEARKKLLGKIAKGGDTPWTAEEDDES